MLDHVGLFIEDGREATPVKRIPEECHFIVSLEERRTL